MKKFKERLSKLKLLDYVLIILIILLSIVFAVITLKDEKPNENNEVRSDLISLSTYQDNDIINLASPDLTSKEYLGNGAYRFYSGAGIRIDYNIFSGIYTINGTTTTNVSIPINNNNFDYSFYALTFIGLSGEKSAASIISLYNNDGVPNDLNEIYMPNILPENTTNISSFTVYGSSRKLQLYTINSNTFINYEFKLQIEKGSQATEYQVPISALEQHIEFEKNNSFNDGYIQGRNDGYNLGEQEGYNEGYNKGYIDGSNVNFEGAYNKGFDDGRILGYEEGYGHGYDIGQEIGWDLGYNLGITENPNNNFGTMITTILLGVGSVLGIELLPNITIGAIIAVPIVFGIIAFVLGRKKE